MVLVVGHYRVIGMVTTKIEFCSVTERLGSTLNRAWTSGNFGQGTGWDQWNENY